MIIEKLRKVNISEILIVILLIIILLQRCGRTPENPTAPQITRDTVWVQKDSTIISKPQLIKTEPYAVPIDRWSTEYLPDTNYATLLKQYEALVRELLAKNIHSDSIKIDSIGHIYITDTVSKNIIIGRSTYYNLKYPIITTTIVIPEKKRNQLYIGVSIQGNEITPLDQINIGFLFKSKKDQMFGLSAGIGMNGQIQYNISSYWKIKLKK
jgi:hypothetical protein